jgi:mono/diheme cytochrome c family protein
MTHGSRYTHRMRRVPIPLVVAMWLGRSAGARCPFTAAQVASGGTAYNVRCASCHRADLTGSANSPSLGGGLFLGGWGDKTAAQ